MPPSPTVPERVLLLVATTSYRTDDLVAAARRLGIEPVLGTDRCHALAEHWPEEAFGSWALDFRHPEVAVREIVEAARTAPLRAIIPTDETTAVIAAGAARALGLSGNAPEAAAAARDKSQMRARLQGAAVPCPRARVFDMDQDPGEVAAWVGEELAFPCVVKPLLLSTSRGVIRADDPLGFVAAWRRLHALLSRPALRAVEDPAGRRILVERFVPGPEVALEGILAAGRLEVLALFDKPDPLDGPFFEETIYLTPSRHPPTVQAAVAEVTARAAAAMGLSEGPIHAELRLQEGTTPQVIEVAARSIGGLCARTLRFGLEGSSLEELVLRRALGRPELSPDAAVAQRAAAGVMMIPTPSAGVLKGVEGVEAARAIPLIEDVVVSARVGEVLVPLPEGSSYLGFVFARGPEPAAVEAALRAAHAALTLLITPQLDRV